jgi:hypothetical protein
MREFIKIQGSSRNNNLMEWNTPYRDFPIKMHYILIICNMEYHAILHASKQ